MIKMAKISENRYPIYDQNGWKTVPFEAAHTYIAHRREYLPPPPDSASVRHVYSAEVAKVATIVTTLRNVLYSPPSTVNRPLSRNAETKDFARLSSHPVRGWTGKNKAFCSPGTQNGHRVINVYIAS